MTFQNPSFHIQGGRKLVNASNREMDFSTIIVLSILCIWKVKMIVWSKYIYEICDFNCCENVDCGLLAYYTVKSHIGGHKSFREIYCSVFKAEEEGG
jgi:hypothetical protein